MLRLSVERNWIQQESPATLNGKAVLRPPAEVLASLVDAFSLKSADEAGGRAGFRRPQVGGVHAVLAHWTTGSAEPITIVMPTGTGKTETMLALAAAVRPRLLLVLVPSDALREQTARKFVSWGVLKALGALDASAYHLAVGKVKHRFATLQGVEDFITKCNVVIATPNALSASAPPIRESLLAKCSHLFVDEAHHVSASTWRAVRDEFDGKPIVQFTATPFREDGRHLGGRIAYRFPLREAQRDGYFTTIDYHSVVDLASPDRAIANKALECLRRDLADGADHLLMARSGRIGRAKELLALYEDLAPEHRPVVLHSTLPTSERRAALTQIEGRSSRVVLCVDMLGEGFDLPALKVAAIHDPHKSLGVTLQFIGRFARPGNHPDRGASVVVGRPEGSYDPHLHGLWAEDADWNLLIRDLSEAATREQEELSAFEEGFAGLSDVVPLRTLLPKMSAIAYRTRCADWKPLGALSVYPEEHLLTEGISINLAEAVAWFVTEHRAPVRWGELRTVEEVSYDLFVLYWDRVNQVLFINSSDNDSVHEALARAVCGDGVRRLQGENVYRLMARVQRLVPTNVGLLDVRNASRRFSMHVGADVSEGFPVAEAQTKTKTNIFARGYEDGHRVGFGASLKGRIWSYQIARSLSAWKEWCRAAGAKLIDDNIDVEDVLRHFIRPKALEVRPEYAPLGLEWSWEIQQRTSEALQVEYHGVSWPLVDADLRWKTNERTGPLILEVVTPQWSADYAVSFGADGMEYQAEHGEVAVRTRDGSTVLSAFLKEYGLTLLFEQDAVVVPPGLLLKPDRELPPYDRADLHVIDWKGVNLRVESQGAERNAQSVQRRTLDHVIASGPWDVVIDDDGHGETADVVAMRVSGEELKILLVHCKFAHADAPGARLADLYEVCGQAQKSVRWRRNVPLLFENLIRRERRRLSSGRRSGFEVGDARRLYELQDGAPLKKTAFSVAISQPGLSQRAASQEQLELLASVSTYVAETAAGRLEILCSA